MYLELANYLKNNRFTESSAILESRIQFLINRMNKTFCISLIARIHVMVKVILPSHRLISYVTRHQKGDVRYSNQAEEFLLQLHKKTYFIEREELVQRVLPLVYFSTHKYSPNILDNPSFTDDYFFPRR